MNEWRINQHSVCSAFWIVGVRGVYALTIRSEAARQLLVVEAWQRDIIPRYRAGNHGVNNSTTPASYRPVQRRLSLDDHGKVSLAGQVKGPSFTTLLPRTSDCYTLSNLEPYIPLPWLQTETFADLTATTGHDHGLASKTPCLRLAACQGGRRAFNVGQRRPTLQARCAS